MAKSTVSLECSHCKNFFSRDSCQFNSRKQNTFFCSVLCMNLFREALRLECKCEFCDKPFVKKFKKSKTPQHLFCSHSCRASFYNRERLENGTFIFRSPKKTKEVKKPRPITFRCISQCTCGKTVLRTRNQLRKSKSGETYCSKSCRMKQHNLSGVVPRASFLVSSEEHILFDLIQADFPELEVKRNCRDILPSGLELDLFIPSLNVAIELNGPVHFFPIYGSERFAKVQDKDIKKQMEASALGLNLIVVDISKSKSKKRTLADLTVYYKQYIKPVLI